MARRRGKWDPNRKGGRRRQAHFMDAAMDGYVRDLALGLWRIHDDLSEQGGEGDPRVLADIGEFRGAGDYRDLWQAAWRRHVWPQAEQADLPLYGRMEAAVREAITEEREARAERGDLTIEDTPAYKQFVARAMGQLLHEASGEIEEMD